MPYRDRQAELLAILSSIKATGLPVVSLLDGDAEGREIPLVVMDPFTFFASFNRGITRDTRRAILSTLKQTFQLTSEVPEDFEGLPLLNLQQSWFFPYQYHRNDATVEDLWALAEACL